MSSGGSHRTDAPTLAGRRRGACDDLFALGAESLSVGDWVLDGEPRHGGFAEVYRARHAQSGQTAAVKILYEHLGRVPSVLRRFRQEAETIRRLRHPHVVTLYEVGETPDGRPWFAMEWIEGRTLREELARRGSLPLDEVVALLAPLADALAVAHALGVVHRDVKAENVMLRSSPGQADGVSLKLLDFGIAKLVGDAGRSRGNLTSASVLGTPHAMAPEQILGGEVDARADIYALGVLLYQLLTGRVPFDAASPLEIEELHLGAPPPDASRVVAVPAAVDAVIRRCLAKRPGERFGDTHELMAALRQAAVRSPASGAEQPQPVAFAGGIDAVAVHVGVAWLGDGDAPDEALDELDDLLDLAGAQLGDAGLELALRAGNALLALAPLEGGELAARLGRERALRAALALAARLAARPGADWRVGTSITVHAGPAERGGGGRWVGGRLLALDDWALAPPTGVVATAEALAGLDAEFESEPLSSAAGGGARHRRLLTARRPR